MKIFDTHAHYNDIRFKDDLYEVLDKCKANDVTNIVNISANLKDSKELKDFTIKLNNSYKEIEFYYTIGIHPDEIDINDNYDELSSLVADYKTDERLVAIGELGLDYYGDNKKESKVRESQKIWFINQLKLAKDNNLPVVIHSRYAMEDTYNILKDYLADTKGVLHCYSYNKEYLQKFLELGLYIGIGGVLTFKNGIKLKEVAALCPLDKIVLETDSPYLAPTPHRGERNDSSYIKYVLEELSFIKNIDKEELSNICYDNSIKLYNLEA